VSARSLIRRLEPRFLEPDRSKLDVLKGRLAGVRSPKEAWARLAAEGFVPSHWADGVRLFRVTAKELRAGLVAEADIVSLETGARPKSRSLLATHPPSVAACALFACDPIGIERSEALAAVARERLRVWRDPPAPLAAPIPVWRIEGASRASDDEGPVEMDVPGLRSASVAASRLTRRSPVQERPERRFRSAVACAAGAAAWEEAVRGKGIVRGAPGDSHQIPEHLVGRGIDTVPDPFEPLLAIWMLGYGVRRIGENAIVLFAPSGPRARVRGRHQWRRVTQASADELSRAILEADLDGVIEMVEDGVDPNVLTSAGGTAVHAAIEARWEESIRALELIARGTLGTPARLDLLDAEGRAPLHLAAQLGRTRKIKALVDLGVSVEMRSADGRRPLHYAVDGGSDEAVRLLLELGADVMARDAAGRTPLHGVTLRLGKPHLAKRLVDAGADPCAATLSGWTPLHEISAARWGSSTDRHAIIDALLGARQEQRRDLTGSTPLDLARHQRDPLSISKLSGVRVSDHALELSEPRNDELEARILDDPGDREAWLVYGDWLSSHGDPRGELIAVDVAFEEARGAERARLLEQRRRLYLSFGHRIALGLEALRGGGWIVPDPSAEQWRRGFLSSLSMNESPPHLLAAMPRIPACRFLERIAFETLGDGRRFTEGVAAMAPVESVRVIRLSGVWRSVPVEVLGPERLPRVVRLDLEGPAVRDLELSWPTLTELRLRFGRPRAPAGGHLRLALELPKLAKLDVDVRTREEGEGLLRVLARPPPITTLRLVRATPDVLSSIAPSLPETLTRLELSRPSVGTLAEIERFADRFERLTLRIDLTDDRSSRERVLRLRERLPKLVLGR
jgi:uncharacterized protein (TIGR02996 family)